MDKVRAEVELAWIQARTEAEWDALVCYTTLHQNQIRNPPWTLPTNHEKAKIVNQILEQSLIIQSSTIPILKAFYSQTHFILSNSCQNVAILLRRYLQAFGVESEVKFCINSPPQLPEGRPHVFLKIQDHIIENTYCHDEAGRTAQENLNYYIEIAPILRNSSNYILESPQITKLKLLGGAASQVEWNFMEVGCKTELNQNKTVACMVKSAVTNPGTWIYDRLMRIYLKKKFNVEIEPIDDEMSKICWNCGKDAENLKTCSGCQIAKYCDKNCITKDWKKMHNMMHKVLKMGNNCAVNRD